MIFIKRLDKLKFWYIIATANLDYKIYMAFNKKCIVQKQCLKLCVVALSMWVVSTALGNFVSAADVYPTITSTQWQSVKKSSTSVGDLISDFTDFIVSWLKKSTSENNYSIIAANDSEKSTEQKTSNKWVSESNYKKLSFVDIADSEYSFYIEELAQKGIVSTKNAKFYPENYIRLNELSKMVVNAYRWRVWYSLNSDAGLTAKNYFDAIMPKYYNTAYEMWLLDGLKNIDDYERFVSQKDFETVLKNFQKQFPNLIHLHYYQEPEEPRTLKRWYVSKALYRTLMLDRDGNIAYGDSAMHKYADAIQVLADLGISNTGNVNFYPDQNITRGDFVVLLVKSYLKKTNSKLSVDDLDFSISDLDYNSQYAPYILYAKDHWFIDYLLDTHRWETSIKLNNTISKHEAYHILSQVANVDVSYDVSTADTEKITRGEVAQLLVDCFALWKSSSIVDTLSSSQIATFISNLKWSIQKGKQLASLL